MSLGGASVYGAYFEGGQGYRNDNTTGVATGNDPETLYMVTAGTHFNGQYVRFVSVAKPLHPAQTCHTSACGLQKSSYDAHHTTTTHSTTSNNNNKSTTPNACTCALVRHPAAVPLCLPCASCCFDYGNAETNNHASGDGTMECVYYGNSTQYGRGAGKGPWVMADMENGMWPGDTKVWGAVRERTHVHSDSCAPLGAVAPVWLSLVLECVGEGGGVVAMCLDDTVPVLLLRTCS